MDWEYAIERHRQPLLGIVAGLYAMIGLTEGGSLARLSRTLYRKVMAILTPAEAAVRRLIIVAARGMVWQPPGSRPPAKRRTPASGKRKARARSFPLVDPRRRDNCGFRRIAVAEPRIRGFDTPRGVVVYLNGAPPAPPPASQPEPDGTVTARPLCRRLASILDALKDLNRQAKRYVRLQAKSAAPDQPRRDPLRRGPPPGQRKSSTHEVHEILRECQWLARTALRPDSS